MKKNSDRWLQSLLPSIAPKKFKEKFWVKDYFCVHAPLKRLKGISKVTELQSVDAVLEYIEKKFTNPPPIRAWFPNVDGKHTESVMSAGAARNLYKSGKVTVVVDFIVTEGMLFFPALSLTFPEPPQLSLTKTLIT